MGVLKVYDGTDWRDVGCGGAGSATALSDTFTRADASTLGNAESGQTWLANSGTWSVASGKAVSGPKVAGAATLATLNSFVTDGTYDVDIVVGSGSDDSGGGIAFLSDDETNFMYFHVLTVFGGYIQLVKSVNNADTVVQQVTTVPIAEGSSHHLQAVVSGANIKCYVDTVLRIDYTMTGPELALYGGNTRVGLRHSSDTTPSTFDNFTGTGTVVGRFKLWDGTQWVREKCDGDVATARPLKMWDGTTWVTVACLVPA